ncbi:hypothetical protein CDL15_Pgr005785 [Punica granatum]|uniref:Uncharacterized protein n=1 Tax=Punica granatum TaxID=22663 RepID=A0A218WGH8_PUNGR|nr:hypothetical protein CDL15_Pgr005785 [Punica granatum]
MHRKKEPRSIFEVYEEMVACFVDYPDLLEEFTRFLPENIPTNSSIGTVTIGSHDDGDDIDDDKPLLKVHKDQKKASF